MFYFLSKESAEPLQCPAQSKRKDTGVGYATFAKNLIRLEELGFSPPNFKLPINEILEQKLTDNQAKWHKGCKDAFNSTKVQRAEKRAAKRKQEETTSAKDPYSPIKRRRSSVVAIDRNETYVSKCFFCDECTGDLHKVSTLKLDHRVRKCASILQDNKLLSKLSCGDMFAQDAVYHSKCLASLYKKANNVNNNNSDAQQNDNILNGLALAEIISHIES